MEEAGKYNVLQKQNMANLCGSCFQAAPGINSAVVVPACNPLLLIFRGERDLFERTAFGSFSRFCPGDHRTTHFGV